MANNKEFYIKYLDNQIVLIETHFTSNGQKRDRPLSFVSHLIAAFQARPGSLLANTDSGLITIHVPEGTARSALAEDCFASIDETDTTLRPGLALTALTRLNDLVLDDLHPLIIKSRNNIGLVIPQSFTNEATAEHSEAVEILAKNEDSFNVFRLKGMYYIQNDSAVKFDSDYPITISKKEDFKTILSSIQKKFHFSSEPSIYANREGTRTKITNFDQLSKAIDDKNDIFASEKLLTPQNSLIINNVDRFNYAYDKETKVIKFPVETGLFPCELVDYSGLIEQFDSCVAVMKPKVPYMPFKSCIMVNGLVKTGKSIACKHIFPAIAAKHFPEALFGYIDLEVQGVSIGCEYIDGISHLRDALWDYLVQTLGIVMEKSEGIQPVTSIESDIHRYIRAARDFGTTNFLVIDELQRIFQLSNGERVQTIFKFMVNETEGFHSRLRIVFTGSTLVRAWNEILKCTSNNFPPYTNIELVQLSSSCKDVDLERARAILSKHYPEIPKDMYMDGTNPATLSYYASTWAKEQKSKTGELLKGKERIDYAIHCVEEKFKNEFLADIFPLLQELPSEKRKVLYELTQSTLENPRDSIGTLYTVFSPFVKIETFAEASRWKFHPSYFSFFIERYIDSDGNLKSDDVSSYLLSYYYKYESLLPRALIGDHVKKPHHEPTLLSAEVESILKDHFQRCGETIDKTTYATHRLFQYLLQHEKNSAGKSNFNGVNHNAYDSYYCLMLVMLRNVICHPLSELEMLKKDIDQIGIPKLRPLLQKLKSSPLIQQKLSSFKFHLK